MNKLFTSLLINLSKKLSRFSICATDLAFKLISMPRKKKKVKMSCRHCGEPNANSATHCMKCDTHHSKSDPCPDLSENKCTRASIINASEPSTNLTSRELQPRKKLRQMIANLTLVLIFLIINALELQSSMLVSLPRI